MKGSTFNSTNIPAYALNIALYHGHTMVLLKFVKMPSIRHVASSSTDPYMYHGIVPSIGMLSYMYHRIV
ncbi:predicted protein, partial [Nematostella vectensis]